MYKVSIGHKHKLGKQPESLNSWEESVRSGMRHSRTRRGLSCRLSALNLRAITPPSFPALGVL